METFKQYGIDIPFRRRSGNVKCVCPKCKAEGKRSHPNDRSLSVKIETGEWLCHYCGWKGRLKNDTPYTESDKPKKEYRRPTPRSMTTLSRKLVAWFNGRGISEWVLKKMRICEGAKFMPQAGKEMNTVQFCYYLNDELVNVKYRTGDKKFMLEQGAELIPYNIDNIADKNTCIITEGEMDCLSFVEVGKINCVSVPNGASNNLSYLDDFVDGWFEDKDIIYIAVDTDSKGLSLRDELVRRFGAERCKIVTYGDDCKDANEHLVKYGKESLQRCLNEARDVKVEGVFTLHDYESELDNIFKNGLPHGFTIGHPNFDKLCSFETKRLAVVTGVPGSGKSEFIDEMCVRINILYDFKIAFFSPENMPFQLHAVKLLEKLCGHKLQQDDGRGMNISYAEYETAKEYFADNFFHILPENGYTIDNILIKAKYLVRKHGIRVLVIDPYNRIESGQNSRESETQYISRVLDNLTNFAQQNDILVFLMAHPRKINKEINGGVPTLYDINGSANFYNKADFGIVVHRYREQDYTLVRIEKVKFRHLGECGDAKFKFNTINGRYVPWSDDIASINFDNTNFITQKRNNATFQTSMNMSALSPQPNAPSIDNDLSFWATTSADKCPF